VKLLEDTSVSTAVFWQDLTSITDEIETVASEPTDDAWVILAEGKDIHFIERTGPLCSRSSEVADATLDVCYPCSTMIEYNAKKNECTGVSNGSKNGFFDWEIVNLVESRSVSTIVGYKLQMNTLDWVYGGPGGGFANFIPDPNILVTLGGYTVTVSDVVIDAANQSFEFWVSFNPALTDGQVVTATFSFTDHVIDSGQDSDLYRLALMENTPTVDITGVLIEEENSNLENPVIIPQVANTSTQAGLRAGTVVVISISPFCSNIGIAFMRMF
jgi:hypothetical protein